MAATVPTGDAEARPSAPVNILLVDDSQAKLLSYEAMLGDLGENLIRANSGNEALELLLHTDVAVILLDVCMPGMDGFELAAMVRRHPRFQKTAIIHVSAVNLTELDRLKGYQSGAVDYVSVPIVPELLRAKVRVFADLYRKTQELERLNRELEDRVGSRTVELEASLGRLRENDRRKDEFLAMLAHELRNPLAAISNAVGVARRSGRSEERAQQAHEVIDRQTRHLSRLIDDLLDASRIARDKLELQKEPLDLADAVSAAVDSIRPQIESRGSRLTLDLPKERIRLSADRVRLAQVVMNLLDNAAKFTPSAGEIGVQVRREGDQAVVRVTDSGIGISPDALSQIFEMFYQADQSLERTTGGLGLGLTLARRLVQMHGGSLEARSAGAGRGSEFVLRLPVLADAALPATAGDAKPVEATSEPVRVRALVADDNEDTAETFAVLLGLHGHEAVVAHDGETALEVAERFRPQVVLLDIGMPRVNGYDVARRIREKPWGKDILLIATTGWSQPEDRQRTREAGFDVHLVKPVEPDALMTLLAERLKNAPQPPPAP